MYVCLSGNVSVSAKRIEECRNELRGRMGGLEAKRIERRSLCNHRKRTILRPALC